MGLGATLVGAIVGAAVGVGLHQFLEVGLQFEAPWFAIIIGLLTGLGVRQANKSLVGRVSYLRGAISGLVALGAIVGSIYLVSVLMAKKDAGRTNKPVAAAAPAETAEEDAAATEEDGGDAAAEAPVAQPAAPAAVAGGGAGKMGGRAEEFNVWQFVFMAVGAFIAYEFGRGSGPHVEAGPSDADAPQPRGTDPSD